MSVVEAAEELVDQGEEEGDVYAGFDSVDVELMLARCAITSGEYRSSVVECGGGAVEDSRVGGGASTNCSDAIKSSNISISGMVLPKRTLSPAGRCVAKKGRCVRGVTVLEVIPTAGFGVSVMTTLLRARLLSTNGVGWFRKG